MIAIRPPVQPPYASRPVASVKLARLVCDPAKNFAVPVIQLFDAKGASIAIDPMSVAGAFDAAAQRAYLATPAIEGETFIAWSERALLPHLKSAYGLPGAVVV